MSMPELSASALVCTLGLIAGLVFGVTAQRTNFCTMGAVSDIVNLQDYRRFRAWLLAIAVAIAGSQFLSLAGIVDLGRSIYLGPTLGWLGAVLGGLMLRFGMTLAGGCGNRTLVRLGSGSLKSLVVAIVLGIFAYMTLRGLIASARFAIIEPTNIDLTRAGLHSQALAEMLSSVTGLSAAGWQLTLAVAAVVGLLLYCFSDPAFRRSGRDIAGGLIIG